MRRRTTRLQRCLAAGTALAVVATQVALPPRVEAAALGSSTVSAGSVPPPTATAIQSFQPDLFTGRATTSIPLAAPPGRKSLQPNLALAYSSSSRNSWVGVGWGLDIGSIERSTKNGVPQYSSSDTFMFMFQGVVSDLVQISDGTYRAKDEGAFLKVMNNGGSGWEIRDKAGTRYLFGQTAASQIENSGQVFRWALDQVIDPNGNTLTIIYAKDQRELYPAQIDYTGHVPTSLAPVNRVAFLLEDRPDIETSYRSGFAVTTAKRLKEVSAYAPDPQGQPLQLARKYVLGYSLSSRTGRSLLTSVTQRGTDGTTSLPPTTLTYQDTGAATYPNMLNNVQSPPSIAAWNVRKAVLDTGHDNWGCANPYLGLPWGSPVVANGGFDLGCVSGGTSSNGDLTMSGCQDTFGHVWTYVYVATPRTLSISATNGGCLYKEDAGGVNQVTGGSTTLQAGWSIIHMTNYHQHENWGPSELSGGIKNQVDVMNPSQVVLGVPQLVGDVNGDARTDLIKFSPQNGSWSVSLATSSALAPGSSWLSGFGSGASSPVLGDWNGDGKTDLGTYSNGSWQFATSTGTSFQTGLIASLALGSGIPITGDFNGDGLTDIGTYNTWGASSLWTIALATGTGFAPASSFAIDFGDPNYEPLTGDFNGDGLTDIAVVRKTYGDVMVALSTGIRFVMSSPTMWWLTGFGANEAHLTADFNGDGLTDIAYYNRATGQVIYAPSTGSTFGLPATLPATFTLTAADDAIQVGDFNGDGIADPAAFNLLSGSSQLALSSFTNADGSNSAATDALRTIANGLGGLTTLTYQPATLCGCDEASTMPFVLHVLQKVTQADGLGNSYTTTYQFHGGVYDGVSKEFRGFERATVYDANGNKAITEFYQDDQKKGRPFRTEFRDQFDALWTKTEQTWGVSQPYPGVSFVRLDQTDSYIYDGNADFKQVRSRFQYDNYGNAIRSDEDGDVNVTGDERSTTTTFSYNTAAWILNKPSLVQTFDATGTVVAQRRFSYDGATDPATAPVKGNLTKEEEWLNLPSAQWLATSLTYDAYGNLKTVTDALTRTTTNTYDASGTYLIQIANALGHTRQLAYDPRLGQVLSSTDQNGQTTTTAYDALGRVSAVTGPNDTVALPTISYAYDLSTLPIKTAVSTRIQSGAAAVLTVYSFSDGLGRTIQTRSPAEDPAKQVVSGAAELDARGMAVKQWAPYLDASSQTYVPHTMVSGLSNPVTYTYDPVGRILQTTNPDGSVTLAAYNDGETTTTLPNGSQTKRRVDAYGRLAQVDEVASSATTYTTTYAYDTLGNLLQVTDAQGNTTRMTYDSLGRKLSMDDPDMRHWAYGYDAVDNLTSQTDARGVTINFAYDALNRLTQKSYAIPAGSGIADPGTVTYRYDNPAKAFSKSKLTEISDGSGSSSFEYDNLGRLIKESKTVDGTAYTIQRSYDLLGRLTALTYPDNEVASYTYNAQGGIETVSLDSLATGHSPLVTDIAYNAAGQLTKITYGNGVVTDYSYNPQTLRLDRLVSTGPSGPLQDFSYEFDSLGNVAGITDRVHTGSQTFQYDALSRLTRATGAYGTLNYAYDSIGNMTDKEGIAMRYGENGAGPHAVTSSSAGWAMRYDANGNMIEKVINGDPVLGELTTQTLAYDAENRLVRVDTAQDDSVDVTFQPGWNFFSLPVIPDNGAVAVLLPSFAQDFEQIAHFEPATNTFTHYVGNPTFDDFSGLSYGEGYEVYCKTSAPVMVTFKGKLPSTKLSKSLTAGWRLLPATTLATASASSWLAGVDYTDVRDAALSPVTQVSLHQAYWVNVRTASTFSPSLPRDPTTRFVYDGDGGKVKQITSQGTTVFLGESYEIASDGTPTKYVFAGSHRIASISSSGSQVAALPAKEATNRLAGWLGKSLDLLANILTPTAEAATGPTIHFYLTDHLGSTNLVTDATGAMVELNEHVPYGALSRHEGVTDVAHKFTGQRLDADIGLYDYHARFYDPTLGRFIQADPIVQAPSDPQSLNRYAYCRNNPINFVDPSGYKWSWKKFFGIVAIVAAAVVTAGVAAPAIAGIGGAIGAAVGEGIGVGIEAGIGAAASFAATATPYAAAIGATSAGAYFATHNSVGQTPDANIQTNSPGNFAGAIGRPGVGGASVGSSVGTVYIRSLETDGSIPLSGQGSDSTGGHSWLEYRSDRGVAITFGTWGNEFGAQHMRGLNVNTEVSFPWTVERFTYITEQQEAILMHDVTTAQQLGTDAWHLYGPCSDWAADTWYDVTGENLQDRNILFISNPTTLGRSIIKANQGRIIGRLGSKKKWFRKP